MTIEDRVAALENWASGFKPPVDIYTQYLTGKKLTLPVNKDGQPTGNAHEIFTPELFSYSSQFMTKGDNKIVLTCPSEGAHTDSAKFPRTEFRYLKNWKPGEDSFDEITYSVDKLHASGKVATHQWHRVEADPLFKEVFGGGKLRCLIKKSDGAEDTPIVLLPKVELGQKITSRYEIKGNLLIPIINGKKITEVPVEIEHDGFYKAGVYIGHGPGLGDTVVTHYLGA
jgi:hypothetical protein